MSGKFNVKISTDQFEELPDAPPKSTIRLSWVGKISLIVVSAWIFSGHWTLGCALG